MNCQHKDCPHVQEHLALAADLAVKRVFAILGVDIDVPKDVENFRQILRFSDTMRKATTRGSVALIGMLFTAIVTYTIGKFLP